MISTIQTALSGLAAFGKKLDVRPNNLANLNKDGFKSSRVTFGDVTGSSSSGAGTSSGSGIGVWVTSIQGDFSQGIGRSSSDHLHLRIDGDGFFIVADSQGGRFFTRAGAFQLDGNGRIVTPDGLQLQGFLADSTGNLTAAQGSLTLTSALAPGQATANSFFGGNLSASGGLNGSKAKVTSSASAASVVTGAGNNSFAINLGVE